MADDPKASGVERLVKDDIEFTARGQGYYRVLVNGEEVSRHVAEREALESATNRYREGKDVRVIHDYEVTVDKGRRRLLQTAISCPAASLLFACGSDDMVEVTYTSPGIETTNPDITPDAFTFVDQSNVPVSDTITSNTITISGLRYQGVPITVSGTNNPQYQINGGAWVSLPGTVFNGYTVAVRHESSAFNSITTNTTVTIGTETDVFSSTTTASGTTGGLGLADPTLATNPDSPIDFSVTYPFIDMFKYSREWAAFGTPNLSWEDLNNAGHLDTNGWPVSIPAGYSSVEAIWDRNAHLSNYFGGKSFTVSWDGTGTVALQGPISNVVSGANQITFDFTGIGLLVLRVTSTNAAPNNVRNITVIDDNQASLYAAGERINPDLLQLNSDMRLLRFLNWQNVNNDDLASYPWVTNWADRTQVTDATYGSFQTASRINHVPLELQVEYCNKVQADGWFNLPSAADDNYITQFATYVRDNLDSTLVAHYELSNEVWNFAFDHWQYYRDVGRADWPGASGESDIAVALNAFGKRTAEMAAIINTLYSGIESRRVNVIGGRAEDVNFDNEQVTGAPLWQTYDPGTYVRPSSVCQALAIAPYYGTGMIAETATLAAQYAAGTHIEWMYDWMMDAANESSIPYAELTMSLARGVANTEGLDLLMYEGMRHYLHGNVTGDALTAMIEFTDSVEDADLALRIWNLWETYGDGPPMVFSDMGVYGPSGAWGYVEFFGDTSPYADILFELNAHTPNWWTGTGDYRHSTITGAVDYRPTSGDAKPLATRSYFHVFGHSLFTYDGGDVAPATSYTRAGEWLGLLAASDGRTSVGSFTFGFYANHNSYNWGVPSSVEITGSYDLGNTEPYTGDISNSNYTVMLSMPSNFLEADMGFPPFTGTVANTQADMEQLIDNINSVHGDMPHVLYVHWPNDDNYGAFASNLRSDFTTYNNSTLTDYLDWHVRLQDAVIAGGRTNLRTFPVGPVIAWLFENESYLQPLLFQDVYGDSAPHGSENIYLLAAMVCYRCIYGTGPNFTNFTIPPAATQIRSEVANNLVAIDAAIRDRIAFHRANGVVV